MTYEMQCLICNNHQDTNLTHIQEHVMEAHGYTVEDLRAQTKRQTEDENGWIFTMPDGRDWLYANRVSGNVLSGV